MLILQQNRLDNTSYLLISESLNFSLFFITLGEKTLTSNFVRN